MTNKITHEGEVLSINNDLIKVRIIQKTACAECHAKTVCNLTDTKEKIIEIPHGDLSADIGDKVRLEGSNSLGMKAVLFAFVIPLLVIFLILIILSLFLVNDVIASFFLIGALVVYYFFLYLFRERMKNKFVFTLIKLNN